MTPTPGSSLPLLKKGMSRTHEADILQCSRETDSETDRQAERERHTHTHTQPDRERDMQRDTQRDREKHTDRQTDKNRDRQRGRETHTHRQPDRDRQTDKNGDREIERQRSSIAREGSSSEVYFREVPKCRNYKLTSISLSSRCFNDNSRSQAKVGGIHSAYGVTPHRKGKLNLVSKLEIENI